MPKRYWKKQYIVLNMIIVQNCLEDTRQEALRLSTEIINEVNQLGGNDRLVQMIQSLTTVLKESCVC